MKNAWFDILDPDGFKHCGDKKIRLYKGGFWGNPGKSISKFVSNPIGSIGGLLEDTIHNVGDELKSFTTSVSHELAGLDDAVNDNLPGGWLLPAIVVAAYFGVPPEVWETMLEAAPAEAGVGTGVGAGATGAEIGTAATTAGATGAGAAGVSGSTAFWQSSLQFLVDSGVPWEIASALPAAASAAGTGSLVSGIQAALTGQDVFKAALTGGVFSLAGGTIANSLINAGISPTLARVASQATMQAIRTGKIDVQSLAVSAAMGKIDSKVATFLNEEVGIPKSLIPTAVGAFNQALLTGEVDPAKLAAQATGQFAKESWDAIKNDLKDNPTPAPIGTLWDPKDVKYLENQDKVGAEVDRYNSTAKELTSDIGTYQEKVKTVEGLQKEYEDADQVKNSLVSEYEKLRNIVNGDVSTWNSELNSEYQANLNEVNTADQKLEEYNREKSAFETPVTNGSSEDFGLTIIQRGDEDNPTIYGDAKGGSYLRVRIDDDQGWRRIDSAFPKDPPPTKDELTDKLNATIAKVNDAKNDAYKKAIDLRDNQIPPAVAKVNEVYARVEPIVTSTIKEITALTTSINDKQTVLKTIEDNIKTPKDGNLADQLTKSQAEVKDAYSQYLSTNLTTEERRVAQEKQDAEDRRIAQENKDRQDEAERQRIASETETKRQAEIQRQAEIETQRQAQETQRQAEIQRQAEEKQREAEAEVRKQTELAEFARLAKEGADQAKAEEAARVAREEAQRQSQIATEAERQRIASEVELQRQAEIQRQAEVEIQRQAEIQRQIEVETQRQAEIQRQTEADAVAEMERLKQAESERQAVAEKERLRVVAEENENARIRDEEQKRIAVENENAKVRDEEQKRIANENKIQEDKDAAEKQRIAELAITNAEKNADKYAAINSGTITDAPNVYDKFGGMNLKPNETITNVYIDSDGQYRLQIEVDNGTDKPSSYEVVYDPSNLNKPEGYEYNPSVGKTIFDKSKPEFDVDGNPVKSTEKSNLPTETTETPVTPNIPVDEVPAEEYTSPLDVSKKPEVTPNIPTTTTAPTTTPTTEPTTTPTTEPTSNLPVSSTQPTDNTKTPTETATTPTNGLPVKSDTPSNVVPALGTPVGSDTSGTPVFKNPESPTGFSYSDGIPAVDPSSKTGGSGTGSPVIVPTIGKIGEYAGTDSGGISVYTNPTSPSGFSYSDGNPAAPPESSQPSSSVDSTDTTSSGGGNLPVTTPNGAGDVTTPNDGKSSVTSPSDGGSTVTTPSGGGGLPVTEPNGGIFVPYGGTEGDGTNPTVTNPIDVPLIPDDTIEVPPSEDTTPTECAEGFVDNGYGFCVPIGEEKDPTACPEGYLWDGNACVPVNNSPATGTGTYKLPTSGSSGSSGSTAGGSAFPSSSAKTSEPTYPDPSKRGFLSPNLIKGQGGDIQLYSGLPSNLINIPFKKEGGEVEGLHPDLINILMKRGVSFTPGPEDRLYARHPQRGFAVGGAGTGQSDDIPTMLSDGEYVIDADTVAALGDGSSKAGALALDKMREEIRKHKRSAPTDKIPPKAKSPLEYLNLSRRKKHG